MSLNVLRNFCRVLQISPKHFKISQYKSCPVFRQTQLSCWVAFQIWKWDMVKNLVNTSSSYSPESNDIQSLPAVCEKFVDQNIYEPLQKL
jgi:hypothetical protein